MRGTRAIERFLWVALLTATATGCTSWSATKATPEQIISKKSTVTMRVAVAGGSRMVLHQVRMSGDTLFGITANKPKGIPYRTVQTYAHGDQRTTYEVAIPHALIQEIAIQKVSAAKTTILIVGLGLTVAVIVAAATASGTPDNVGSSAASDGGSYMSCPLIFSAREGHWYLDSGTYAGAIMPALARSDVDRLEHANARDGIVRVRLAGLNGETEYVDALSLIAVDHSPTMSVEPDAEGRLWMLGSLSRPTRAVDFAGMNAQPRLDQRDGWAWESALAIRSGSSEGSLRDGLEISFPRPAGTRVARLVIDGTNTPWAMHLTRQVVAMHARETGAWYSSVAADPARKERIVEAFAAVSNLRTMVWTDTGWEYQGYAGPAGPESIKRQVIRLDLSHVTDDTIRVRLECTPNLWLVDCVSIDFSPEKEVHGVELPMAWAHDLRGKNVAPLLASRDHAEYVFTAGDTAELAFQSSPLPAGEARTYFARTTGWYRIHAPETGDPETVLLEQLESQPGAARRFAIGAMNEALPILSTRGLDQP